MSGILKHRIILFIRNIESLCLIVFLLLLSESSSGQNLYFYGLFPNVSTTGIINKHWNFNIVIYGTYSAFNRSINHIEYPPKILRAYFEPSITYKYNNALSFAASISYNYERIDPLTTYFKEWRPWQQIIYKHDMPMYKGKIFHRLRLEERFIGNSGNQYLFSDRLRYRTTYIIPLKGETLDVHEFYIEAFNEFYFSLSKSRNRFYSENWISMNIGYQTGKMGRIEIGPFYQSAIINKQQQRRNILLQIEWETQFAFKKNKS